MLTVLQRFAGFLGAQSSPPIGLSYALRTATSAAVALFGYRLLGAQAGIWAVVSAVVVIQPDARASVAAAALRVVANIVGAGVGLLAGEWLGSHQWLGLIVGLFAVAFLCRVLRLDAAARSASVSLAIVLLKDPAGVAGSSAMRVLGVLTGCGVAFLVTVVAARIECRLFPARQGVTAYGNGGPETR